MRTAPEPDVLLNERLMSDVPPDAVSWRSFVTCSPATSPSSLALIGRLAHLFSWASEQGAGSTRFRYRLTRAFRSGQNETFLVGGS